ncbi:F-box family protein [Thalictrum thalictroides]|uniref:F-box family protein n=1 Tax=Thalictrum thalictroides TaxID=46969 RepID=A0A7J6XE77_THATH|nr:F-box family protein [Thalictrum thalictroides]
MMMDHLPSEITTQIISFLPVKSVLQCRSVCKSWRNLIDDRRFAESHFTKSLQPAGNINDTPIITSFLFLPSYSNGNDDAFYVVDIDNEHTNTFFKTKKIKFSSCPPNFSYNLYDQFLYVDGLLCFSLQDGFFFCLCNPATQDWVNLTYGRSSTQLGFGFGLDHTITKFKLAVVAYFPDGSGGCTTEAQVLTLGSNSWRDLKNVPQVMCSNSSATVQGSIHWLTHSNQMLSFRILLFNLAYENFLFLELPKCYLEAEVDVNGFHMLNFGGDLSVVDFSNNDRVEIWVMKEYGVKESWTRLTIIKSAEYIQLFPISPWKDGEILLLVESKKLVSYNFESGRYTLFQVNGLPGNNDLDNVKKPYFYDAYLYVGNLLSVQPTDYSN